jgi:DNA polymerase-3 subunit alpha
LLLEVDAKLEDEQLRMTCQRIASLDQEAARAAAGLRIFVRDAEPLSTLAQLVEKEARGRNRILLVAQMEKREVEMAVQRTITISPGFMNALRSVAGVVEVEEI